VARRIAEADAEAVAGPDAAGSRPLVFALLGATGVGKSSLFNALVGRDASPVSTVERCYTKAPHVAAAAASRPLVSFLDRHRPVWCDEVPETFPSVLIDTPDIDGMLRENREVARAVVQEADVVVFVTDPDRRSNLVPLREVAAWAGRKHWIFVLNKGDQIHDRADVVRDWDERLRAAGFEPDASSRMVVSVRGPDHLDLERLRRLILEPRTAADRRTIWLRNLAGRYRHAIAPALIEPVRRQAAELGRLEQEHLGEVRSAYRAALGSPLVSMALGRYVRDRTWLSVAGQGTGLLAPSLWVRARFSAVSQSLAIARLTRGSVLGLAAAAGAAALETMRGLAGLRRALDLMGPELRDRLDAIARTARRQVEDRGLARLLDEGGAEAVAVASEGASPSSSSSSSAPIRVSAGPWSVDVPTGSGLVQSLERLGLVQTSAADDVLAELYGQTERLAVESAGWATRWFPVILGNLLPLAALGDIVYRIGRSWIDATYLPLPFYLMAAAVFGVSLLPGYWLIGSRVSRSNRHVEIDSLVDRIEAPGVLRPLRQVRERLDRFVTMADALESDLDTLRGSLPVDPGGLRLAVAGTPTGHDRDEIVEPDHLGLVGSGSDRSVAIPRSP
jgi:hypothetical protein